MRTHVMGVAGFTCNGHEIAIVVFHQGTAADGGGQLLHGPDHAEIEGLDHGARFHAVLAQQFNQQAREIQGLGRKVGGVGKTFQFEVQFDAMGSGERQHLAHGGQLAGENGVTDDAIARHEDGVVRDYQNVIPGDGDVQLKGVGSGLNGVGERRQSVFRHTCARAPMPMHQDWHDLTITSAHNVCFLTPWKLGPCQDQHLAVMDSHHHGLPSARFLEGGGELGELIRKRDWSQTSLGPVESWPQALKTAVGIMLTSRQPMFVWWGDELINLYNDAYKSIVGGKHPQALGQPASVVWREIWDQVGPRAESAISENKGTYDEALLLIMERNGYSEETYYTFSYSPVPNDEGGTGGIFCANSEDTQRIIGERQLALLRDLAASTADARTIDEACARSALAWQLIRATCPSR